MAPRWHTNAILAPLYAVDHAYFRLIPSLIKFAALFFGVFQCFQIHILKRYLMLLSRRSHSPFMLPILMLSTDVAPATKWNVLQLIDCSPLRSIPITGTSSLLWPLLTSHSSLLLRLMEPPVRPPRLRCALFPLIYLPHLLVLPATFGLHRLWPTYPYFPALYVIPVRQAKGLPTASFRSHLAMDTLAVQLCTSSLPTRTRDFHPLERAHGAQTTKISGSCESYSCRLSCRLTQEALPA